MPTIAELEEMKTERQAQIERGKMAQRLANNRDFKKLMLEEFLIQDTARLAHICTDPRMTREQRDDALEMVKASGHLKRFLEMTNQMALNAARECEQIDTEIELMRQEEDLPETAEISGDLS